MDHFLEGLRQFGLTAAGLMAPVLIAYLIRAAAIYRDKMKAGLARDLVDSLVKAAEQMYGAGQGERKKAYVKANAPAGVSDAMIEAAVHELTARTPCK